VTGCGGVAGGAAGGAGRGVGEAAGFYAERLAERERMVKDQIQSRGVLDPRVLAALRAVPRHRLMPAELAARASDDSPQSIGEGQTISQPYIVALMSEAAAIPPGGKVLEVGTGSGYQAAVLARLAGEVLSIERRPALAESAARALAALGIGNVRIRVGDGALGWPEEAPFDAVLVTCAPARVPAALLDQLAPGGRLVVPVGEPSEVQTLLCFEKDAAGRVRETDLGAVRFVPLV
jgi:protein-L-isoaspartate(D-aspartate) O-methyltransferase